MSRIVIIGSTGWDRLLTVKEYPAPDAKVRTTAYHEVGGGNAANSAAAMGRVLAAGFCPPREIQLLTKVGTDLVGQQIVEDLQQSSVDLSSPLFCIAPEGTTTGLTTIVVDDTAHTRTCIHTPGTCGELTLEDLAAVNLDHVFDGCRHFHSDARHTDVALVLAVEARRRAIPVSLDVEKDRQTPALDAMLELIDILFTSGDSINAYLQRLTNEWQASQGLQPLLPATMVAEGLSEARTQMYAAALQPILYLTRRYQQAGKEVVVSKGAQGALHYRCESVKVQDCEATARNDMIVSPTDKGVMIQHSFVDLGVDGTSAIEYKASYAVTETGVLQPVTIVDTTGAGDAFIGAYVLYRTIESATVEDCLRFGCWVAGRKLAGPGARTALPSAVDVDEMLGRTADEVQSSLRQSITDFRHAS